MKRLFILLPAVIFSFGISAQEPGKDTNSAEYVITYQKDGKTVSRPVELDSIQLNELHRMAIDPHYVPVFPKNDTIFNEVGNPDSIIFRNNMYGAAIQKFEYDSLNRPVKIIGLDQSGRLKAYDMNIAFTTNQYDTHGDLIEIRNYGEDGKLIPAEFETTPIIKMFYNEKHQQIEVWYMNEHEKLREEYAILRTQYDDKGTVIAEGWHSAEGKKK